MSRLTKLTDDLLNSFGENEVILGNYKPMSSETEILTALVYIDKILSRYISGIEIEEPEEDDFDLSQFNLGKETNQMIEYWEIQTRSADESPTRFFKCLSCSKQWREYD